MEKNFHFATNVEEHFGRGDTILRAVLDIAERGREHAEGIHDGDNDDRFNDIIRLIGMYQEKNSEYVKSFYRPKGKAA